MIGALSPRRILSSIWYEWKNNVRLFYFRGLTLYPIQYRLEVEIPASFEIAVAGCSQQRRANSAGVAQSSAEWGRLSL
jgi:hypothetical protein